MGETVRYIYGLCDVRDLYTNFEDQKSKQRIGQMAHRILSECINVIRANPDTRKHFVDLGLYGAHPNDGILDATQLTERDLSTIVRLGVEKHGGYVSLVLTEHLVLYSGQRDEDGDAIYYRIGSENSYSHDLVKYREIDLDGEVMQLFVQYFVRMITKVVTGRFEGVTKIFAMILPTVPYVEDEMTDTLEVMSDKETFSDKELNFSLFRYMSRDFLMRHAKSGAIQSSMVLKVMGLGNDARHNFNIGFYTTTLDFTNRRQLSVITDIFNDPIDDESNENFDKNNDSIRLAIGADKNKKNIRLEIVDKTTDVACKSSLVFDSSSYDALHYEGIPKMVRSGHYIQPSHVVMTYFSPETLGDNSKLLKYLDDVSISISRYASEAVGRSLQMLGDDNCKFERLVSSSKFIGG